MEREGQEAVRHGRGLTDKRTGNTRREMTSPALLPTCFIVLCKRCLSMTGGRGERERERESQTAPI